MYCRFTATTAFLASCTLLVSTAFVNAEEALLDDSPVSKSSDLLKTEVIPSFKAILVDDDIKMAGTCAAEPGPSVCAAKALPVAGKMRAANFDTSLVTYVESLTGASLFFRDCWSCLVSDMTTNGHVVEELCRSLEDARSILKDIYFASTAFPVPPICDKVLFKIDEDNDTDLQTEALVLGLQRIQVGMTSSFNFDKCNIETKIDFKEKNRKRSIDKICKPETGTGVATSIDVGTSALGILLDGSQSLPIIGFAATSVKAIYGYVCMVGGDSGAALDADRVYKIALEAAKDAIKNLIDNDLVNISNKIQADLGNPTIKPNAEEKIAANRVASYASQYMEIATRAGTLGIAGHQAAVAALSHSLSFLGLVKDVALKENESACVDQIDNYLLAYRESVLGIRQTAKDDFEALKRNTKIYHRYINKWFCVEMYGPGGLHHEYEAYVKDRRGADVESTKARFKAGAFKFCWSKQYAKVEASKLARPKVNAWLDGEERVLFTSKSEKLFNDFDEKTNARPKPAPIPGLTPGYPPSRPCKPYEICPYEW